jgi:tape measure domain-containing protein
MAGNLQWTLGLADKMSGPARAAGGALDALSAKLRSASEQAAKLDAQKPGMVVNTPRHVRDDVAKRIADVEKLAAAEFAANMARRDTMRDDVAASKAAAEAKLRAARAQADKSGAAAQAFRDATALEETRRKALEAAKAMDRLRAASRAAAASPMVSGRAAFNKTGSNTGGLFGRTQGAQGAVGRLAQTAGNIFGDRGANAVLGAARAIDKVGAAAKAAAGPLGALKSVGSGALSMLGSLVTAAAAAAAAVGAIGIGLAAAGARYIVGIQSFKSSMMVALAANLGGARQGEAAWAKIASLAVGTGNDLQQTAMAFNGLLAGGFKIGEAEEMMRLLADMKTLDPSANLEGIALAIKQIKMTGKLQGDELNQLGNAVSVDAVYTELAKKLGKTKEEVIKLKEQGKISADDAIEAIKRATLNKTGMAAGGLAEAAASKTLVGNLMKAKAVLDVFLSKLKIDFSPVARFLERVQKVLTGDAGAKLGKSIEGGFAKVLGILDSITEKDIATAFAMAGGLIDDAGKAASDFAGAIKTIDGWLGAVNSKTNTWGLAFSAIGGVVRGIGDAIGTYFLGPLYVTYNVVMMIVDGIDKVIGKLKEMGKVPTFNPTPGVGNSMGGAGGTATTGGGFEEAMRKVLGLGAGNQATAATPAPAPGGPAAAGAAAAQAAANVTKNITVTVTANGLTFAGFEQKVAEIVEAKLGEQD